MQKKTLTGPTLLSVSHVLCAPTLGLSDKMQDMDLSIQSDLIRKHNERMKEELKQQWQDIFRRLFQGQPPAAQVRGVLTDRRVSCSGCEQNLACMRRREMSALMRLTYILEGSISLTVWLTHPRHRPPHGLQAPREQIQDFDESMAALYNVKVHGACEGDTHF